MTAASLDLTLACAPEAANSKVRAVVAVFGLDTHVTPLRYCTSTSTSAGWMDIHIHIQYARHISDVNEIEGCLMRKCTVPTHFMDTVQ